MFGQNAAAWVQATGKQWVPGIAAAFVLGFLVLPVGDILGAGLALFAMVGLAGFVSVIVRPGWPGFLASAAGLTAYVTVIAAAAGFAGLQYLFLAFMLPAQAAGAGCGTIANRVRTVGFVRALAEPRVWAAAAAAVILVGGLVWFYVGLVTSDSPP